MQRAGVINHWACRMDEGLTLGMAAVRMYARACVCVTVGSGASPALRERRRLPLRAEAQRNQVVRRKAGGEATQGEERSRCEEAEGSKRSKQGKWQGTGRQVLESWGELRVSRANQEAKCRTSHQGVPSALGKGGGKTALQEEEVCQHLHCPHRD